MKKKFFAGLLVFAVCATLVLPVFAIESVALSSTPQEAIALVLQSMAPEAAVYGLEDVDFSDLALGNKINAYEVTSKGVQLIQNIEYYPIFSDNHIVAVATIAWQDTTPIAQLSTALVDALAPYTSANIALLFDQNKSYVWDGTNCIQVGVSASEVASRTSLTASNITAATQTVNRASVQANTTLLVQQNLIRSQTQNYLQVPKVQQPTDYSCWAACVKSIGSYHGVTRTIDQIYVLAGVQKYQPASINVAWNVLESLPYNFSITGAYAGATSCLAFSTLQYYIDSNQPLYGAVHYSDVSGHALVIRGYYNYTNSTSYVGSISYMNPGTGAYEASNVAASGARPYIFTDSMGAVCGNIVDFFAVAD